MLDVKQGESLRTACLPCERRMGGPYIITLTAPNSVTREYPLRIQSGDPGRRRFDECNVWRLFANRYHDEYPCTPCISRSTCPALLKIFNKMLAHIYPVRFFFPRIQVTRGQNTPKSISFRTKSNQVNSASVLLEKKNIQWVLCKRGHQAGD